MNKQFLALGNSFRNDMKYKARCVEGGAGACLLKPPCA
jgi:hypothetical protein